MTPAPHRVVSSDRQTRRTVSVIGQDEKKVAQTNKAKVASVVVVNAVLVVLVVLLVAVAVVAVVCHMYAGATSSG
jgi:hypothetical protein